MTERVRRQIEAAQTIREELHQKMNHARSVSVSGMAAKKYEDQSLAHKYEQLESPDAEPQLAIPSLFQLAHSTYGSLLLAHQTLSEIEGKVFGDLEPKTGSQPDPSSLEGLLGRSSELAASLTGRMLSFHIKI